MKKRALITIVLMIVITGSIHAQLIFEKSEYVQRREKLMDMISDGIAVFRGASGPEGVNQFFQYNKL